MAWRNTTCSLSVVFLVTSRYLVPSGGHRLAAQKHDWTYYELSGDSVRCNIVSMVRLDFGLQLDLVHKWHWQSQQRSDGPPNTELLHCAISPVVGLTSTNITHAVTYTCCKTTYQTINNRKSYKIHSFVVVTVFSAWDTSTLPNFYIENSCCCHFIV